MKLLQSLLILLASTVLIACSSTPEPSAPVIPDQTDNRRAYEKRFEKLYLRGTFSLWDYEEPYRLLRVKQNIYAAAVDLTQGKTVEFMFSAKDASKTYANCGYRLPKTQALKLGKKVKASCTNVVLQNFKFTPETSGVYEFFINFTNIDIPRVYVQRAY